MKKGRRKSPPVTLVSVKALAAVPTTTLNRDSDPTPERLAQAGATVAMQLGSRRTQIIGALRGMVGADSVIRITQAPLDRLHARDQLDPIDPERNRLLYEAGEKLRTHHFVAGLSGYAAANDFGRVGGSDPFNRVPITEAQERHRRALRRAEDVMDAGDWQVVRDVVLTETTLEDAGNYPGPCAGWVSLIPS